MMKAGSLWPYSLALMRRGEPLSTRTGRNGVHGSHRPDARPVPTRVRSTLSRVALAVQGSAPHRRDESKYSVPKTVPVQ